MLLNVLYRFLYDEILRIFRRLHRAGRGRAAQVFHHDGQCLFQLMHLAGLKYIPHHTQADGPLGVLKIREPAQDRHLHVWELAAYSRQQRKPVRARHADIREQDIRPLFPQHGLRRKPIGRGSHHFAAILRPGHHLYQAADDDILVVHDHHLIHPISPHCFCLWS